MTIRPLLLIVFFLYIIKFYSYAIDKIDIKLIGNTQVDYVCYFTFVITNNTDKDVNEVLINLNALSKYNFLIGKGVLSIKNINKTQPYTQISSIPLNFTKNNDLKSCKYISSIEIEFDKCILNNNEEINDCIKLINFDKNKDTIKVQFKDSSLDLNYSSFLEESISELRINVVSLNKSLANRYTISNYTKGLVITKVDGNNNIFMVGDLLIEAEMLALYNPSTLKRIIKTNLKEKKSNTLISFLRKGKEKWVAVKLN